MVLPESTLEAVAALKANGHLAFICTGRARASVRSVSYTHLEHDNCGIGAVVNIKGIKTHETVENALKIVENLKHRAGKDADGKTCLLYTS